MPQFASPNEPRSRCARRLRLRLRPWLLLALTLGACDSDAIEMAEPGGPSPDAASSVRADASSTEPVTTGDRDASSTNHGDAGMPGGGAMDASARVDGAMQPALDAASEAEMDAEAAAPTLDAQLADARLDASDATATNDAADANKGDTGAAPDAAPSIYDDNAKWLCRPGLPNSPCLQTLEITDIHADGGTSVVELPKTPSDVPADCLYLYPTVDPGLFAAPRNLDFNQIDRAAVTDIFFAQAVPFRATCALYAPLYRQMSLNSFEQEATREKGLAIGYGDLEAAFDYYLRHAAPTRPIVLIAHSQGAITMTRLLQRRFEGHPELLQRLVVAVLAGPMGGFTVPEAGVVGGALKEIPLCTSAAQTGCVLTYNSFAASLPPGDGYTGVTGTVKAGFDMGCTTPPGGGDGSAARLTGALFPTQLTGGLLGLVGPRFDFGSVRVRTRYARYANFYTGRCADSAKGLSYLRIAAEPLAGDVRRDPVPYDHITLNDPDLGLHALDYTFVSGDLVQAVETKIAAHGK